MEKIKVIISTFGPLHLIKSAEFLSQRVDIKVIQGWIPNRFNKFLLVIASKIVRRDLSKTIKKRMPTCLDGNNYSVGIPEFYLWFGRYLLSNKTSELALQAAEMYGKLSRKYIKEANVFHVRSGSGLGGAIEKARASGMKIVVDHSIAHPQFMDKQLKGEYEKNNALFDLGSDTAFWKGVVSNCEKADCLLVNSFFVKDTFVQSGYDESKIKVAYLGVREDFFQLKKNYSYNDVCRILFTGSFGFRKGAEYLLRALQELDKQNFSYEMTVVGSYEGAEQLIDTYKPKHINFVGHILQDELKKFLSESDIYLFPSLCEGCASSGMEAMAAGLPIITTEESGLPVDHMIDAVVVPSKDADSIVKAILMLTSDNRLRQELGANAAAKISESYTWEKYAANVHNIYHNMTE